MLSLRTCSLKCVHLSCLRTLEDERLWQGKPSRSALNQKVSLVKAGKQQHTWHLKVLIRGTDSKDRFIRMELPFLPSLNSSAVWCMFWPVASPALPLRWKMGIPPRSRVWQRQLSPNVCVDKHAYEHTMCVCVYESEYVRVCEWVCVWVFYSGYISKGATYTLYFCNSMGHLWIFQNKDV